MRKAQHGAGAQRQGSRELKGEAQALRRASGHRPAARALALSWRCAQAELALLTAPGQR